MYICKRCGATTEYPEIKITERATRYSPEEKEQSRCECGGHFVEAERCVACGEYYPTDELKSNVCEYCLDEHAESSPYQYGLEIGEDNKTDVYINGLIPSLLTPDEINKILLDYIYKNCNNIKNFNRKCEKYCREDMDCFAQYVEEKVNAE
jgi:DNA-directed RNA polymerase subunit RPC12/RpoP